MSAKQLQRISVHFRRYEKLVNNNEQAKRLFMESMEAIFFKAKKRNKCEIIEDSFVDALLKANVKSLNILKAGKPLVV